MNRLRNVAALAALVFVSLACPSHAQASLGRIECRSMHSEILGRAVRYCAILPPSYDENKTQRYPVLYFLHGLGENEQMLVSSGGWNLIEDLWEQKQLGEFLTVTPDADTSFYINSRDGRQRYEDFFLREFLPFIEHAYRTRAGRHYRGIGGISMGGYGALHLAFRHPELFGSTSASSAALIGALPNVRFANPRQSRLLAVLGVFGTPPDPAFWLRNDPLTLARTAHLAGLKIYFDCGAQDDYGFEKGAKTLHDILASRGIPHEFHLYPGGHDWRYFAAQLPAALEFHSHAFGLGPSK
ncbi:MAG TPA: alpha/beta hydrolase family protein [Candidatus Acidoferrales bacterium]|nr:alpha/beta hydrolase family protein [Candidatus Acidoferrales bacterium]